MTQAAPQKKLIPWDRVSKSNLEARVLPEVREVEGHRGIFESILDGIERR